MRSTQTPNPNSHIRLFLAILFFAFAVHCALALTVKTCLDGDESAVGVMAHHIEDRGEHPLFLYGQHHGGGHSIEAHGAAVLNRLLGRANFHLQIFPAIGFAFLAAFAALLASRAGGSLAGWFVGVHLIFAPQFLRSSLRVSGYMETLALGAACAWIVLGRPSDDNAPPAPSRSALIGFLMGLAWWWHDFSLPLSCALALIVAYQSRRRAVSALKSLAAWIFGFAAGAAPLLFDNFRSGFSNMRHLVAGDVAGVRAAPRPLIQFFTRELPQFFQNDNWGEFRNHIPPAAWALLAAAAIGWVATILLWKRIETDRAGRAILKFSGLFCLFYLAVCLVSPFRGESARHMLPLEPFLAIGPAAAIAAMLRIRKAPHIAVATLLLLTIALTDARGFAFALRDNRIGDGFQDEVACREFDDIQTLLESKNIKAVFTNKLMKWMILYRTNETIAAADANLRPDAAAWSEYEQAATAAPNPAFLFNRNDPHTPWLMAYLRAHRISAHIYESGRFRLIVPSRKVSQFDFMDWSNRMDGMRKSKETQP